MNRNDWLTLVLIIAIVGIASYFVVGALMPSPKDNLQKVPTAVTIPSTLSDPSDKIFNSEAINPTVKSSIGDQSDIQPFDIGDR